MIQNKKGATPKRRYAPILFGNPDIGLLVASRHAETLLELVDTTACIDKLLLAGEERMALRANFNAKITLGGSGLYDFAACTSDRAFLVFGMETLLHIFRTSHSDSKYNQLYLIFSKKSSGFAKFLKIFFTFSQNP